MVASALAPLHDASWGSFLRHPGSYLSIPPERPLGHVWFVEPGSPLDKAGLKVGDVLTHMDGQRVNNFTELRTHVMASYDRRIILNVNRFSVTEAGPPVAKAIELVVDVPHHPGYETLMIGDLGNGLQGLAGPPEPTSITTIAHDLLKATIAQSQVLFGHGGPNSVLMGVARDQYRDVETFFWHQRFDLIAMYVGYNVFHASVLAWLLIGTFNNGSAKLKTVWVATRRRLRSLGAFHRGALFLQSRWDQRGTLDTSLA